MYGAFNICISTHCLSTIYILKLICRKGCQRREVFFIAPSCCTCVLVQYFPTSGCSFLPCCYGPPLVPTTGSGTTPSALCPLGTCAGRQVAKEGRKSPLQGRTGMKVGASRGGRGRGRRVTTASKQQGIVGRGRRERWALVPARPPARPPALACGLSRQDEPNRLLDSWRRKERRGVCPGLCRDPRTR